MYVHVSFFSQDNIELNELTLINDSSKVLIQRCQVIKISKDSKDIISGKDIIKK
jgi:hypothetical protein